MSALYDRDYYKENTKNQKQGNLFNFIFWLIFALILILVLFMAF